MIVANFIARFYYDALGSKLMEEYKEKIYSVKLSNGYSVLIIAENKEQIEKFVMEHKKGSELSIAEISPNLGKNP